MNFVDATKAYFFKWKDFDARISRSEFWYGNLGTLFVSIIIGTVVGVIGGFFGAMMDFAIDSITMTKNRFLVPFYLIFLWWLGFHWLFGDFMTLINLAGGI